MSRGIEREWPTNDEMMEILREHGGNVVAVSRALGVSRSTLVSHLRRYKLEDQVKAIRVKAAKDSVHLEIKGDTATIEAEPVDLGDIDGLLRSRGLEPGDWIVVSAVLTERDTSTGVLRKLEVRLRRAPHLILVSPAHEVSASPKVSKRLKTQEPEIILVESDHQCPYFDPGLDAAVLRMLDDIQPDEHILLGDLLDLPTISKYTDNPSMSASVQECVQSGYELIKRRREVVPGARCRKLKGNHDYRLESELLMRAERLYGLKPADTGTAEEVESLSLRKLLHLDELGVELVTDPRGWAHAEIEIVPGPAGLVARHGWLTGHNSAKRSMLARGRSLIVGHGHHREHYFQWDPSSETERQAVMIGTMSRARDMVFPAFAVADLWLQGCLTVTRWPDGRFALEHARWDGDLLRWRDRSY